jgi:hypothetical protein
MHIMIRRLRGALGMGVVWAVAWACLGVLLGVTSRLLPGLPWGRFFEVFDAPLPALAIPGFIGGVLFSLVLGVAGRGRRFDELSVPKFAAWGLAGGLLLSLVPAFLAGVGLAQLAEGAAHGAWSLTAVIAAPLMLLSAASAAGSLMIARAGEGRAAIGAREASRGLGRGDADCD